MTQENLQQHQKFTQILKQSFVDAKEDIPEPPVAISKGRLNEDINSTY